MKRCLYPFFFLLLFSAGKAQERHVFSLGQTEFLIDGKPFQFISGEMHPARIPVEYWRHRIQMAKAMGCNAIAAYIFWNYHETSPGVFDFKTGNRNIASFIKLCQEEGMWVLLRPGPYVCAEWDFGGLPAYLLKTPDIRIRCMDPRFISAADRYIDKLAAEIKSLQCTAGGPIIMLQIENEYGSYANDKTYLEHIRKQWIKNGMIIPFFTGDGPTSFMLEAGNIDGAAIGLDSGGNEKDFEQAKKRNPNVPAFSSETYPGWLTHWGEKFARADTSQLKKEVEYLLKNKKSFNFYVIHGGTNFGLTAGANAFSPIQYQPDITSYDYDAPINEQGRATPKFFMLKNLISKYVTYPIPDVPPPVPVIDIPAIRLVPKGNIWTMAKTRSVNKAVEPLTMESVGQDQGFIIYRTKLIGHKGGKLTIWEPHDYALVFLNNKFIDTVYRDGGKWTIDLPVPDPLFNDPVLEILVEGMGHINYGQFMTDHKGITDRVTLNGITLMNWSIISLPVDSEFIAQARFTPAGIESRQGIFFRGFFDLNATGDTYFDMSNYSKGFLFVNGHNLGRYWNIGPQQRLYCPASWLKKGRNEISVFDLHQLEAASISGKSSSTE
jgi:beta-galactosidase